MSLLCKKFGLPSFHHDANLVLLTPEYFHGIAKGGFKHLMTQPDLGIPIDTISILMEIIEISFMLHIENDDHTSGQPYG